MCIYWDGIFKQKWVINLLLCHLVLSNQVFRSTTYFFCSVMRVRIWLIEFLLLSLVYWVYIKDWDPPLSSFCPVTLCEKQNLCFLLALNFHRIVFVIGVLKKTQIPNPLFNSVFYSALLSGSTMDVLDWQKHRKGNGTVHSVQLQWREEAVDINKFLQLENQLHTKGFVEDLGGGRTPTTLPCNHLRVNIAVIRSWTIDFASCVLLL